MISLNFSCLINIMGEAILRRLFLQKCFSSALLLAFVPAITGSCRTKENKAENADKAATSSDPCQDYSALRPEDIKLRESFGYVIKSPTANKQCNNCNLWFPPVEDIACGKCQLIKGPVLAEAFCTYWVPQV